MTNMMQVKKVEIMVELARRGWNRKRLADELGVDQSYVSLVLNEKQQPSTRFVAGVLKTFPERRFEDLFQVS